MESSGCWAEALSQPSRMSWNRCDSLWEESVAAAAAHGNLTHSSALAAECIPKHSLSKQACEEEKIPTKQRSKEIIPTKGKGNNSHKGERKKIPTKEQGKKIPRKEQAPSMQGAQRGLTVTTTARSSPPALPSLHLHPWTANSLPQSPAQPSPGTEDAAQLIKFVLGPGGAFNVQLREAIMHLNVSRCPRDILAPSSPPSRVYAGKKTRQGK